MGGFSLDIEAHAIGSFRFDLKVGYYRSFLATTMINSVKELRNALDDVW